MDILLATCLTELKEYCNLYMALYSALEPLVKIEPSEHIRNRFTTNQSSILKVIKYYPKDEFLFPPAAWVYPNRGQFEYKNQTWEYLFHGGGLSFFDNQSPRSDISVEFTRDGRIALTANTFQCYLDSVSLHKNDPIYRKILHQHNELLNELVKLGHLVPVTPILIHDDQTFVLAEELSEKDKGKIRFEQKPRVIYIAPENKAGRFEFLVEVILAQLEQFIKQYPDEEDMKLVKWLHFKVAAGASVIEVPPYQWERIAYHVADIIESGNFRVFCRQCGQYLPVSSVFMEEWSYDHGFLDAGGGRRFFCQQKHELLKVQEWIS